MNSRSSLGKPGFAAQQWALIVIGVALTATVIRLGFWLAGGSTAVAGQVYFYDMGTRELFAADANRLPPITAPSDTGGLRQGVRAFVYACGNCTASQPREIGYLLMYTSEYVLAMDKLGRGESLTAEETSATLDPQKNTLVRRVDDDQWHPLTSREGQRVIQSPSTLACPDGVQVVLCTP